MQSRRGVCLRMLKLPLRSALGTASTRHTAASACGAGASGCPRSASPARSPASGWGPSRTRRWPRAPRRRRHEHQGPLRHPQLPRPRPLPPPPASLAPRDVQAAAAKAAAADPSALLPSSSDPSSCGSDQDHDLCEIVELPRLDAGAFDWAEPCAEPYFAYHEPYYPPWSVTEDASDYFFNLPEAFYQDTETQ
ncbi:dehydration-responsive element-binding protein 3-like [Iris pallida]|uniref:Dehydration-responsive element-binding protein 3-like n=1 Tax=Iris pallida TaxID=29817 RepID=A0AAX6HA38_IRIPA|nr:dehydration-responsive element-binding protein 3-like [Iris pallida]